MRVTFVGHASVLLEHDGTGVLSDPWLTGTAFNESWVPYPQPQLPAPALDRVTHLWISHEHPDHLSVPTLKSIPAERRRGITALVQRHWSPLPAAFLRSLGFRDVVELPHNRVADLGGGVRVRLYQVGHEDAALAVHAGGSTVLNLNDCKPGDRALAAIRRAVGPIDLLLDQFSIAGWPGNPDDPAAHAASARRTLDVLGRHVDALAPRMLLPFASFVRFAHVENAFMNAVANTVGDVVDAGLPTQIAGMYPGDAAPLADVAECTPAAASRYQAGRAAIGEQPLITHDPVAVDEVVSAASGWVSELQASYHQVVLRRIPPLHFSLTDGGGARVALDVGGGTVSVHDACDGATSRIELSTQAAVHTFSERWGFPTLLISGRFRVHGTMQPFARMKQLGALYSNQMRTRGLVRDLASYRGVDLLARRGPRAWLELAGRVGSSG